MNWIQPFKTQERSKVKKAIKTNSPTSYVVKLIKKTVVQPRNMEVTRPHDPDRVGFM
jgi:hypothetical protein